MNVPLIIANALLLLAFVAHTFVGDRELKILEPQSGNESVFNKREKWTMVRNGWHMVSVDLLFATTGLALINFTDYVHWSDRKLLLLLMAIYFLSYGIAWLIGIVISKRFPNNYWKLGQWILLFVISGLIFFGVELIWFNESRFSTEILY